LGDDPKLRTIHPVFKYPLESAQWENATTKQTESTKRLVKILNNQYNLTDKDIYAHGSIFGHKKQSEGENII